MDAPEAESLPFRAPITIDGEDSSLPAYVPRDVNDGVRGCPAAGRRSFPWVPADRADSWQEDYERGRQAKHERGSDERRGVVGPGGDRADDGEPSWHDHQGDEPVVGVDARPHLVQDELLHGRGPHAVQEHQAGSAQRCRDRDRDRPRVERHREGEQRQRAQDKREVPDDQRAGQARPERDDDAEDRPAAQPVEIAPHAQAPPSLAAAITGPSTK
jgi:hypothetical protein